MSVSRAGLRQLAAAEKSLGREAIEQALERRDVALLQAQGISRTDAHLLSEAALARGVAHVFSLAADAERLGGQSDGTAASGEAATRAAGKAPSRAGPMQWLMANLAQRDTPSRIEHEGELSPEAKESLRRERVAEQIGQLAELDHLQLSPRAAGQPRSEAELPVADKPGIRAERAREA